jgi:DNA-binding NtrC family response regulator
MQATASENILIVDDEDDILQIVSEFVSRWGYTPILAHDGEDALAKISEVPIDMMITDLRMPKADGMVLLDKVKELDPDTVVILFTGYPAIDSAVDAFKKGAFDYLTKPIDLEVLKKKIEEGLKTRQQASSRNTLKGLNWAMIISIPFWLVLGIIFAHSWLK